MSKKKSFAYSFFTVRSGVHVNFNRYQHRIRVECSDATTDILEKRSPGSTWFKKEVTDAVVDWFTSNDMKLERHVIPQHHSMPNPPILMPETCQAFYVVREEGGGSWRWSHFKPERTWITFHFTNKEDAMKFKLAWSR